MKNYFRIGPIFLIFFFLMNGLFFSSCSSKWLRIHSEEVPPDSLRLAQVIKIHNRSEILQFKETYNAIITSGIPDAEIKDGRVVQARVWCCGGPTGGPSAEVSNAKIVFVPKGMKVNRGDIIEIRSGYPSSKKTPSKINMFTRVIQKANERNGHCWWEPKDNRLWLRVLYCDWMPSQGWIRQGGIFPAWYKPTSSVK